MSVVKVVGLIDVISAMRKATAWGTALALGAGHGQRWTSMSMGKDRQHMPYMAMGSQDEELSDLGNVSSPVNLVGDMEYDGFLLPLALLMGTAGVPAQQGATAAYKHQLQLADSIYGNFATFGANFLANIFEAPSWKPTGFTLKGPEKEGAIALEVRGVAFDLLQGSAVNTVATFANVTFPYIGNRVLFRQGVFRMNTQGGAALASPTDVIKVKHFEFSFDRPQEGEYTSEFGHRIDEPTNSGRRTASLKLDFARYDDDAKLRLDAFDAETLQKADIAFTGAVIEGAYNYGLTLRFPQLKYERPEQDWAEGLIPQSATYRCQKAQAAPTGMASGDIGIDLVAPFMVEAVCKQTADPLA